MTTNGLEKIRKEEAVTNLRYHLGNLSGWTDKNQENLIRDSNWEPSKY
jgi:hypothetical protein